MDRIRQTLRRIIHLFRRDNFDLEMEEEIRTHLEMKAAAKWTMAFRRLSRYAAKREFGNQARLIEETRNYGAFRGLRPLYRTSATVSNALEETWLTVVALLVLA